MATSSASLDRSPRKNWVEEAGGLPPYVRKIARAIHEKRGIPLSQAIPYAIGRLKKWAAGGDSVSAETQAKAAAAIAAWERLKAKSGKLTEVALGVEVLDENLGVPSALLLAWIAEQDTPEQLVEATPPKRVDLLLKSGRTVNVSVDHARRLHAAGKANSNQRPGAADGDFEKKHPRGGKGTTAGGKFVSSGSSGTEVRAVQRRVGARVDGAFGNQTTEAVKRFQKSHGLVVDGVVGRQTVAAMRGRRDAKRVKTGALSKRDREYLAGHIRGTGRQRQQQVQKRTADGVTTTTTKTVTSLVEAVAPPAFLERVQALEPGEIARLPDGAAVKHHVSEDGRNLWTAGRPSTYETSGLSWRENRRTPEDAVTDALTASASSTDPASIAGTTRLSTYSRVTVNGQPARFAGVDVACRPLVRYDGQEEATPAAWPELALAPR